jgi:hypothetical protein
MLPVQYSRCKRDICNRDMRHVRDICNRHVIDICKRHLTLHIRGVRDICNRDMTHATGAALEFRKHAWGFGVEVSKDFFANK